MMMMMVRILGVRVWGVGFDFPDFFRELEREKIGFQFYPDTKKQKEREDQHIRCIIIINAVVLVVVFSTSRRLPRLGRKARRRL